MSYNAFGLSVTITKDNKVVYSKRIWLSEPWQKTSCCWYHIFSYCFCH